MSYPSDLPKLKVVEDVERKTFTLTPNTTWRQVDAEFANAAKEKVEDYIYNMCLNNGANAKLIAQRFGYDVKEIEKLYGAVIKKAQADLILTLYGDQITAALESTSAAMKQHAGKFFAGQFENQSVATQDADGNDVEIQVKLVKVNPTVTDESSQEG